MTGGERGYLAFLHDRDGETDVARHTLSAREARYARAAAAPVRSRRRFDAERFQQNLARRRPEPDLDEHMLWLLATAKANQAERFGVGLGELYGTIDLTDPVRTHVALQEVYHTRLLGEVVALFGLRVRHRPPTFGVRTFIKLLIALPERWQLPLSGAAEMAGCVLFRALRDKGVQLFADEPAVAERIRFLYDEILADEIGHVGYIASQLGPTGRAVTRTLYRLLGTRFARAMPELGRLFGRDGLRAPLRAPFHIEAMVRALPGRAYAAATM